MFKAPTRLLALFLALQPALATAQQFPSVPAQSVIGRLGQPGDTGPSQAIPFSVLISKILSSGATITGTHNGGGTSAAFLASALGPAYAWQATGQPADQKVWDAIVNGGALNFRAVNDANTVANPWMTVTRGAGATVSDVSIPNLTAVNPLTGFFFQPDGARVQRFADRVLIGGAVVNAASNVLSQPDWLTQFQISTGRGGGFMQYAQGVILTDNGSAASQTALITGAQTKYITGSGNAIAGTDIGVNNNTAVSTGAFGRYIEVYRGLGVAGGAAGLEIDPVNYAGLVNVDPFQQNVGQTIALQIAAGAELSSVGQFSSTAAINIQYNNSDFAKGINIGSNAIHGTNGTDGNVVPAITMATGHAIKYYYGAGNVNWTLSAAIGVNGDYNFATTGGGAVSAPAVRTPFLFFGSGAPSSISVTSTNTGFQNALVVSNAGTVSNSATVAVSGVSLTGGSNAYLQMVAAGGATPSASIASGSGLTGGFNISAGAGVLSLTSPTLTNAIVTGSFTATGLVTNADLTNSTISGVSLGSNLNALTFGAHLTSGGSSYNGSAGVTITSDATSANTASTIMARDGSGQVAATTFTGALTGHASLDLAISALGTGVQTALGVNIGSAGAPVTFNGAGGTPSSLTLTNATGLPTTALTGALQAAQEPAHTGDVTNTAGSLALTLVTAQPAVHTWALAQTFTVAPVFTDQSGSRSALGLGSIATQSASAVAITGGTIAGLTGFAIRDTSAAFDVTLAAVSSTTLTAGRTLTLDVGNVAHTLKFGTTANTITFPNVASDTVVMLGATQTLTGVNTFSKNAHYQVVGGTGGGFWLDSVTTGADRWFFGSDATFADSFRIFSVLASSNVLQITASATAAQTTAAFIGTIGSGSTTVGGLPSCTGTTIGHHHFVTDSNAVSYTAGIGTIVAAGGSTKVPVTCDSANWRIGANDNAPAHLMRKYA